MENQENPSQEFKNDIKFAKFIDSMKQYPIVFLTTIFIVDAIFIVVIWHNIANRGIGYAFMAVIAACIMNFLCFAIIFYEFFKKLKAYNPNS